MYMTSIQTYSLKNNTNRYKLGRSSYQCPARFLDTQYDADENNTLVCIGN